MKHIHLTKTLIASLLLATTPIYAQEKGQKDEKTKKIDKELATILNKSKDPFNTTPKNNKARLTNSDDTIILDQSELPQGIAIKGIIKINHQNHIILKLPGYTDSILVRIGESVRISKEHIKTSTKRIAKNDIYIKIIAAEKNGVKIIQESRPDQVIILR